MLVSWEFNWNNNFEQNALEHKATQLLILHTWNSSVGRGQIIILLAA